MDRPWSRIKHPNCEHIKHSKHPQGEAKCKTGEERDLPCQCYTVNEDPLHIPNCVPSTQNSCHKNGLCMGKTNVFLLPVMYCQSCQLCMKFANTLHIPSACLGPRPKKGNSFPLLLYIIYYVCHVTRVSVYRISVTKTDLFLARLMGQTTGTSVIQHLSRCLYSLSPRSIASCTKQFNSQHDPTSYTGRNCQ